MTAVDKRIMQWVGFPFSSSLTCDSASAPSSGARSGIGSSQGLEGIQPVEVLPIAPPRGLWFPSDIVDVAASNLALSVDLRPTLNTQPWSVYDTSDGRINSRHNLNGECTVEWGKLVRADRVEHWKRPLSCGSKMNHFSRIDASISWNLSYSSRVANASVLILKFPVPFKLNGIHRFNDELKREAHAEPYVRQCRCRRGPDGWSKHLQSSDGSWQHC